LDEFVSAAREYYTVHYGSPQAQSACRLTYDDGLQLVGKLDLQKDLATPATFLIDEKSIVQYAFVAKDRQDRPSCKTLLEELAALN
jgi:peroxiredoxin